MLLSKQPASQTDNAVSGSHTETHKHPRQHSQSKDVGKAKLLICCDQSTTGPDRPTATAPPSWWTWCVSVCVGACVCCCVNATVGEITSVSVRAANGWHEKVMIHLQGAIITIIPPFSLFLLTHLIAPFFQSFFFTSVLNLYSRNLLPIITYSCCNQAVCCLHIYLALLHLKESVFTLAQM